MRATTVCFDLKSYERISQCYPLAISTFGKFVGTSYSLDSTGFLPVDQLPKLDNREQRQRATNDYINRIIALNPQLGRCLQEENRDLFNRALLSLYDHGINDEFEAIKKKNEPTCDGTGTEILQKMEQDEGFLERTLDDPIEAIDLKSTYYGGINETKRKLEELEEDPSLAVIGLLCADPAYFMMTLDAHRLGVRHPAPDIREATWAALGIWAKSLLLKINQGTPSTTIATLSSLQNKKDLGDLQLIFKALWQNGCGLEDKDSHVQAKAKEVFETCKIVNAQIPKTHNSIVISN